MIRKKNGTLEWLEFELFADCPSLAHGIFLRHGGVSAGEFTSLNFGGGQGDSIENITENKKRALSCLKLSSSYSMNQVHGKKIQDISSSKLCIEADAMITNQPGMGLLIQHADCQAAIFYDPIHQAIANVHCGWRGNVLNIYEGTVKAMKDRFGSQPADLLVGISPSLGPHASEFRNYRTELPDSFCEFQVKPLYFDLWEISRSQLQAAGVLARHIEIAEICTYQNREDFFSYRRVKASGRHATIAAIR